jgi:hypothetical protein
VGTKSKKAKAVSIPEPEVYEPIENDIAEPVSINVIPFDTNQGLLREMVHGFHP